MPLREPARLIRRSVIAMLGLGLGLCAAQPLFVSHAIAQDSGTTSDDFQSFEPGQFSWHPERSPKGPVAIIVSIPKQLTFVKKRLKAGTVLVTTDLAATPDTRSDKSMVVMDGPAK